LYNNNGKLTVFDLASFIACKNKNAVQSLTNKQHMTEQCG